MLALGWFFEARNWWARHLLFWFYRFSDSIFSFVGITDPISASWWEFLYLHLLPDLFLVYFNLLLLVPGLLLRKKITLYCLMAFNSVLAYAMFTFWAAPDCVDCENLSPFTSFYQYDFLDGIELLGISTGLRIMIEYFYASQRMQALRSEKLHSELAYLKNQINPHFLFNTLNNIATLSETRPERVTPTIVQLSKVLRYQLYESEKNEVLLTNEIENLRHNLDLEALRLNNARTEIGVVGNPNGLMVAPLLFLPFLENAVKHSADSSGGAVMDFQFKIEEKTLIFTAENSKPAVAPKHIAGGIGLKNIRRRLELLYPKRHELDIAESPDKFRVVLKLDL